MRRRFISVLLLIGSTLFAAPLAEAVVPPGNSPDFAKLLDLLGKTMTGYHFPNFAEAYTL